MSHHGLDLQRKLAGMRRLFDQSFAMPVAVESVATERLLAFEATGEKLAAHVRDINEIMPVRGKILPVPSSVPELLGILGIRGVVVPVYKLAVLLGMGADAKPPAWLALCGGEQAPIALAFDSLEGYVEVSSAGIYSSDANAAPRYVNETARVDAVLRGIINIPAVVKHIRAQGTGAPSSWE
jgi:chemotaxis signal transduction protein